MCLSYPTAPYFDNVLSLMCRVVSWVASLLLRSGFNGTFPTPNFPHRAARLHDADADLTRPLVLPDPGIPWSNSPPVSGNFASSSPSKKKKKKKPSLSNDGANTNTNTVQYKYPPTLHGSNPQHFRLTLPGAPLNAYLNLIQRYYARGMGMEMRTRAQEFLGLVWVWVRSWGVQDVPPSLVALLTSKFIEVCLHLLYMHLYAICFRGSMILTFERLRTDSSQHQPKSFQNETAPTHRSTLRIST